MLQIIIPEKEYFDEDKQEFFVIKSQKLQLEHSLVSIAKWESKWKKPFFSKERKTIEESIDYVKCMTITQNVNPMVYYGITQNILDEIDIYMEDSMTATWFSKQDDKPNRQVITAEIIYYWMIAFNIPIEFQRWHINRLLTMIRVCDEKNKPQKKMSRKELLSRNRALNASRRKKYNSKG